MLLMEARPVVPALLHAARAPAEIVHTVIKAKIDFLH
jgi:hypothetical protein